MANCKVATHTIDTDKNTSDEFWLRPLVDKWLKGVRVDAVVFLEEKL
jgi:hypothetical protein